MSQKIKEISLKSLVLWTENPRDPVDANSSDQDIADRSISSDSRSRWSLKKLFEKMGRRFDQSELPTVVYINKKPVVYDGNRRVLIGKIIHGFVQINNQTDFSKFDFPESIPCNVCDKQTALQHVDRKHADSSGSWKPLERDIFKCKHMGGEKSPFLIIEESTHLISSNPELNQGFVRDEIFDSTTLHKMGFSTNGDKLKSKYTQKKDAEFVLNKIVELVREKEITTRKNRGDIIKLLGPRALNKQGKKFKNFSLKTNLPATTDQRKTRITRGKRHDLFGDKLCLKAGSVNNIYSDLVKLYTQNDKLKYSEDFPMLIRMGIRLLCELAFENKWSNKVKDDFDAAKNTLSKDEKTTLSTQAVTKEKIIELLQAGAHANTAAGNIQQTVAISLIIGKLLQAEHGKNK